jgi:hypothetical protein
MYTRFDTRLGWKLNANAEISLVEQSLFNLSHPVSNKLLERISEAKRSFYVKGALRF